MRLSKLIWKGAEKFKEEHGVFLQDFDCGCAVGTAFLVTYKNMREDDWDNLVNSFDKWRFSYKHFLDQILCPECKEFSFYSILTTISHLYESHAWSKKAIAMWLDKQERQEVQSKWDVRKLTRSDHEKSITAVTDIPVIVYKTERNLINV